MAHSEVSDYEISVKLAGRQLEFLEDRSKELGISKEELIRWYIVSDMAKAIDVEREHEKPKKEQFSLMGITHDGRVTDEDIEEVVNEWSKSELP